MRLEFQPLRLPLVRLDLLPQPLVAQQPAIIFKWLPVKLGHAFEAGLVEMEELVA